MDASPAAVGAYHATSPDLIKPGLRAFGQETFYPGYGCYDPSALPLEYFGDAGLSGCGSNELLIKFDSFAPLTGSSLLSENECAESFYPDQGLSFDALPVNDLGTSPTLSYTTPYPPLPNAGDAWIPWQSFGDFLPYTQHLSQEQPSISSPEVVLSLDDQQQISQPTSKEGPTPSSDGGTSRAWCGICNKSFATSSNRDRHLKTQHRLVDEYWTCPIKGCGKTGNRGRKDNVRRHFRKKHPLMDPSKVGL
ncbi:uncharacterized protein E0L32_003975 [Thyridium curvatum]|uniref:C2H2-type domain-containing protein n=1 Tax=Thyridium curvatum TaxID=1093900 RepID=A0A507BAS2_9PEZI|nr:uncharacterized protein E0L32_003975 [Thyridium curvatum]TPX16326.1 hypothetical protein E0L32_003975 [Thyridium curvatum]